MSQKFNKNSLLLLLFPLFLWGSFLYFPLTQKNYWIHPDIAETLYTGTKLIGGSLLYVDWLNVNPPAIYQICELAEILAKVSHLPSIVFYYSFFFLLSFVGYFLLRKSLESPLFPKASIPFYLLGFIGCIIGASFAGPYEFAQREHWFVICFIPYCVGRLSNLSGKKYLYIWGIFLGFVASMKPGFLLLILTFEFLYFLFKRQWAWRFYTAILCGFVLPFLILGWQSLESLQAFFTWALPSYKYYYLGYQEEWSFLIDTLKTFPAMILMPFLLIGFHIYYRHQKSELRFFASVLISIAFLIEKNRFSKPYMG